MGDKKLIIKVRAIILHEGKLLAVRHPHDTSFAALPSGKLEWGEDVKECLTREIIEELGVRPEIGKLLYINNYTQSDGKQYIEFFFEVKSGTDYLNLSKLHRSHAHEIAEIVWVNPTDDMRIFPTELGEDFKAGKVISDEVRYIKV
ncbi:MAG: NUDIX domain-containing protein [Candidatus Pacebacteria bacterium]|nr:NUDIX domain-containing protein [Candidatus Paceibacterota bacterium]MCF7862541.1 NUDIX domain-containing protein [Candidatus Paceibacterota bacterium]